MTRRILMALIGTSSIPAAGPDEGTETATVMGATGVAAVGTLTV